MRPDSSQRFGEVAERLMEEGCGRSCRSGIRRCGATRTRTQFDDTAWGPDAELRNALDALRERCWP